MKQNVENKIEDRFLAENTYAYPAVFSVDEEDPKYINVRFPDIIGGFTFGEGMEDAIYMAKDILTMKLTDSKHQCYPPSNIEEIKKEYPKDTVMMIEVTILEEL